MVIQLLTYPSLSGRNYLPKGVNRRRVRALRNGSQVGHGSINHRPIIGRCQTLRVVLSSRSATVSSQSSLRTFKECKTSEKILTKTLKKTFASALVAMLPSLAFCDTNLCAATVSYVSALQKADLSGWTLTFHVVGGNGLTQHSSGQFLYSLTYTDSNNVPHTGYQRSGPSWAPADNADEYLTDDPQINAIAISNVTINSITSGGCV